MARKWPLMSLVADFTQGPPNRPGSSLIPQAVSLLTAGALREWGCSRGRQYELGQVEAGSLDLDLTDSLEYLNPANTGSPWNTGLNALKAYRCIRLGAWWRPSTQDVSGNLLNATVKNPVGFANDPSFETNTGAWIPSSGTGLTTTTTHAFDGTHSLAINVGSTANNAYMPFLVATGIQHTLSLYVWANAGCTASVKLFNLPDFTVLSTVSTSTTGAWQRLSITFTSTVPYLQLQVNQSAGSFINTVYVDAVQLELGAAATAFTTAGPTFYPIYTGYIERYPQHWDSAGFRGIKPLQAVDALSVLSRTVISQSYLSTILADGPSLYIPYQDQSAPQQVVRLDGGQAAVGYTSLGTSGSVNFSGDSFLDGSPAVSVVQQNTQPSTSGNPAYITYLATVPNSSLSMNPQAFTIEVWAKFSSGTVYFGAGAVQFGENINTEAAGPTYYVGWYTNGGRLILRFVDPNGGTAPGFNIGNTGAGGTFVGYPDGQWHYLSLVFLGSSQFKSIVDNAVGGTASLGFTPSASVALNTFFADSTTYFGDPASELAVAYMACYPTALSNSQALAHYQRGIGYLAELSGARSSRLLTQYWQGSTVVATGLTHMAPDYDLDGQSVLQALQDIADTEGGLVWVDAAGAVRQDSRETRYTSSTTSLYTFGENTAGGELPYLEIEYDFDPTYVYSTVQVSDYQGNQFTYTNTQALTDYGQRILSKTVLAATDFEVQQAGQYYSQQYAAPVLRVSKLTLDPASNPALWAAVLALDIGQRVTVKRRTSAGVILSGDHYIEQIAHRVNSEASTWTVDLQLSPVFWPNPMFYDSGTGGYDSGQTFIY